MNGTELAAHIVSEAIRESGCTHVEIGAACERKRQHIGDMADTGSTRTMTMRDVVQAPPAFRKALVALLAAMDGDRTVAVAAGVTVTHDRKQSSRMAQLAANVFQRLLEALDDGLLDRAEAGDIEPILAELEASVVGLRARVDDAKAAGVDAERRGLTAVEGGAR